MFKADFWSHTSTDELDVYVTRHSFHVEAACGGDRWTDVTCEQLDLVDAVRERVEALDLEVREAHGSDCGVFVVGSAVGTYYEPGVTIYVEVVGGPAAESAESIAKVRWIVFEAAHANRRTYLGAVTEERPSFKIGNGEA